MALSSKNVSEYEFLINKDVLSEKELLEKAAIIKRFEYSSLGKELKAQNGVAKDWWKLFKDSMNVNINNKKDGATAENDIKTEIGIKTKNGIKAEDCVKAESGMKEEDNKIIDNVRFFYIGEEYNNLIENLFNIGLINTDFYPKKFSSENSTLIWNILDKYLVEINKYSDNLHFNKPIKNW